MSLETIIRIFGDMSDLRFEGLGCTHGFRQVVLHFNDIPRLDMFQNLLFFIHQDTESLGRDVSNLELVNVGQIFDGKLDTVIFIGCSPLV